MKYIILLALTFGCTPAHAKDLKRAIAEAEFSLCVSVGDAAYGFQEMHQQGVDLKALWPALRPVVTEGETEVLKDFDELIDRADKVPRQANPDVRVEVSEDFATREFERCLDR